MTEERPKWEAEMERPDPPPEGFEPLTKSEWDDQFEYELTKEPPSATEPDDQKRELLKKHAARKAAEKQRPPFSIDDL